MIIEELSENVVIAFAPQERRDKINTAPFTIPIGCIVLDEGLVFVDCGIFLDTAKKFREMMEKKFSKKTTHLLLTHSHWDHIFAMDAFSDIDIVIGKPGIQTIKRQLKDGFLSDEGRKKFAETRYKDNKSMNELIVSATIFPPKISVKDELTIGKKENQITFKVIRGHSRDSSYIYYNKDKILFTGDNLLECYPQLPGLPNETLKILTHWLALDLVKVVPGHGKVIDKKFILQLKNYYEKLIAFLQKAKEEKLSTKQVLQHTQLPIYPAETRENFEYACRPDDNWLEMVTKSWFNYIMKTD